MVQEGARVASAPPALRALRATFILLLGFVAYKFYKQHFGEVDGDGAITATR